MQDSKYHEVSENDIDPQPNNEETSWAKDSTVTLAVKYASVETAGSFGLPQAFDSSSWDNSCRITVVLELDDMQQWDDGAGSSKAWVY